MQEFILHAQLWIFVHSPIVGLAFKYFLFFMDCEFFHLISFDAIEGNCAGQETLFYFGISEICLFFLKLDIPASSVTAWIL